MTYKYTPKQVCPVAILVDMEGDVLKKAEFIGGCDGNHKGLTALAEGMRYEQIREKLSGIRCGLRQTSCPDQLVKAVEAAMAHEAK